MRVVKNTNPLNTNISFWLQQKESLENFCFCAYEFCENMSMFKRTDVLSYKESLSILNSQATYLFHCFL